MLFCDTEEKFKASPTLITAGASYLDIDAYACMVAMAELLCLKGENAHAYSPAKNNYSICPDFVRAGDVQKVLPDSLDPERTRYIIVDVSDPGYLENAVPLDKVAMVYDHHAGFEEYWAQL